MTASVTRLCYWPLAWLMVVGFVLVAGSAQAQSPPSSIPGLPFWEWQVGQPTGYKLLSQHVFNDSTLIAAGGHGTAVKTSNGGHTWQVLAF